MLLRQWSGKQIAAHLQMVFAAVPKMVKTLLARADSGFYCWGSYNSSRLIDPESFVKHGPAIGENKQSAHRRPARGFRALD